MFSPDQLAQLTQLLTPAQTILVIFPVEASLDQAASALALYLGLLQLGKQVQLLSPGQLNSNFTNLVAPERITTQLGNKDLHVIFDYTPEKVDKVSYHIDEANQKFLLVVQPQKGQPPLDANLVQFEYSGAEADLIFLVGVRDYEQLDQLYIGYEQLFKEVTTISLNTYASTIASVNLDSSGSSGLAEAMVPLLEHLGVAIQDDLATNLLSGIETATDSFKSATTSAVTFETVAKLLRGGARRLRKPVELVSPEVSTKSGTTQMFSQQLKAQSRPRPVADRVTDKAADKVAEKIKKVKKDNGDLLPAQPAENGSLDYQPSGFDR